MLLEATLCGFSDKVGVLEVFSNLSGSVVPCAAPALPHPDPSPVGAELGEG